LFGGEDPSRFSGKIMTDFSNLVVALTAVVGLVVLAVGRIPLPRRGTARGVLVRLGGAVLLLPWPVAEGLAFLGVAAREADGNPPDKPDTVRLITAFVQLVLLFGAGVTAFVLIFVATMTGKPTGRREQPDKVIPRRSYGN
jgi:hypothetical protein